MATNDESVRGYRFGERRRSGMFGTIPPSLAGVGAVALGAAWCAIAGYVPMPIAGAVMLVCGWLWFGKLHDRPAHEILPALATWWWRRLRSRNRWYRPVALIVDGEQPTALPPVLSGIDLFEFDVDWLSPGENVPIGVVRDRQAGSLTAVLKVCGDGQFALVDSATQSMRIDEWGSAIGGFARENSPVARVTFHDWTSPVPIRDTVAQLESRWSDEAEHPAREGYLQLLRDTSATVVDHEVLVEVTVELSRLSKPKGESALAAGLRTVAEQSTAVRSPAERRRASRRIGAVRLGPRHGNAGPFRPVGGRAVGDLEAVARCRDRSVGSDVRADARRRPTRPRRRRWSGAPVVVVRIMATA